MCSVRSNEMRSLVEVCLFQAESHGFSVIFPQLHMKCFRLVFLPEDFCRVSWLLLEVHQKVKSVMTSALEKKNKKTRVHFRFALAARLQTKWLILPSECRKRSPVSSFSPDDLVLDFASVWEERKNALKLQNILFVHLCFTCWLAIRSSFWHFIFCFFKPRSVFLNSFTKQIQWLLWYKLRWLSVVFFPLPIRKRYFSLKYQSIRYQSDI